MSTLSKPQGKAMYVAPQSDKDWLLTEQRKAYARSMQNPDYAFHKLWGLVTDPRNLRIAVERVARNRGRRSAGVDGITVRKLLRHGVDDFTTMAEEEARPMPVAKAGPSLRLAKTRRSLTAVATRRDRSLRDGQHPRRTIQPR